MPTKSDGPSQDTLHEQLQKELVAAEAKEQTAQAQVEAAKAALIAAKSESKKLRAIIELYVGRPSSTSLTKKTVRPLVEQILATGPLSEQEVILQLKEEVRASNLSRTGLALVTSALARDYVDSTGKWSLHTTEEGSEAANATIPDAVSEKGGAK